MKVATQSNHKSIFTYLIWCLVFFSSLAWTAPPPRPQISGQVLDISGKPVAGVSVKVSNKGVAATSTDANGLFRLTGMRKNIMVYITFSKTGYATIQKRVSVKNVNASLTVTLLASGMVQQVAAADGGTLTEGGFKVTFAPNSFVLHGTTTPVTGVVNVAITPIDVSTGQINGAPGDFSATTVSGQTVMLETFSMADFTLTNQSGQRVNLNPTATAQIELLLPASTTLIAGETVPMWYFDPAAALWREEGSGTVQNSSEDANRLAVVANVKHFTWWNADRPLITKAISGRVVDTAGTPVSEATVQSNGINYSGASSAVTDATGNYCIMIRSAFDAATPSTYRLTAYAINNSVTVTATSGTLSNTDTIPSICPNATQTVPDLVVARMTCVSGVVVDNGTNLAISNALVSASGRSVYTNQNGEYQLAVPEGSTNTVSVNAGGYDSQEQQVTAGTGATCTSADFSLTKSLVETTCITGRWVCPAGTFIANTSSLITYAGTSAGASDIGTAGDFTEFGEYCMDNLPVDGIIPHLAVYSFDFEGNLSLASEPLMGVTTNATPGSCAIIQDCKTVDINLTPDQCLPIPN